MWALAGIALIVANFGWVVVVILLLLVILILKHLAAMLKERRENLLLEGRIQASREREMAYRADAENLAYMLDGHLEGQYPAETMPLTRPEWADADGWKAYYRNTFEAGGTKPMWRG